MILFIENQYNNYRTEYLEYLLQASFSATSLSGIGFLNPKNLVNDNVIAQVLGVKKVKIEVLS